MLSWGGGSQEMSVVTVSGKLAGGAREVGEAAAAVLGIDFVDQRLLVEAAQRCGVSIETVAEHDERRPGFRERLAETMRIFLERSATAGIDPATGSVGLEGLLSRTYVEMAGERGEEPHLTDARYLETMSDIIRELGGRGGIVILGRGSQMILRDRPGALHVLCRAPDEVRIERLAQRDGISQEEAAHQASERERGRAAFHRKFWKVDVEDPDLYDLTIDTSRLTFQVAAEIVATAARAKEATAG